MPLRPLPAQVWFCLGCDDQPPWKADEKKSCPTCGTTDQVKEATRFSNLENPGGP
jgi:hypothetical protein